jgi:hypothetical protein
MKTFHAVLISVAVALLAFAPAREAFAGCTTQVVSAAGNFTGFAGSCANTTEVLVTTGDVSQYNAFTVMSTTGSVLVYVSLDGTNYSTAALSLQDFGATTSDPVTSTTALRVYQFTGKFRRIKVVQTGATAAAATILCWVL